MVSTRKLPTTRVCVLVCLFGLMGSLHHGLADESAQQGSGIPAGMILKNPVIPEPIKGTLRSLNETLSRDLVPADNAAVYLVQLFGDQIFEAGLGQASLDMLGIEKLSPDAPRMIYADAFVKSKTDLTPENVAATLIELNVSIAQASERQWKRDEFVTLDDFLVVNRRALDAVVALANKPRYFAPMLSAEDPARLLGASMVIERRVPYLAHLLTARAMNRIARGELADAITDILACRKLASLLAHGSPFDISTVPSSKADAIAYVGEITLLKSGKLTAAQAGSYQRSLESIPLLRTAARAADIGERAILRQEIELLQGVPADINSFFEKRCEEGKKLPGDAPAIKWDLAFGKANQFQDRIVSALATRNREQQNEQFDKLQQDYQHWKETEDKTSAEFADAKELDLDAASKWIGECMAMSLLPQFRQRRATEDRAAIRRDMIVVGLALVEFKFQQQEYPSELSKLVPQYLKSIPSNEGTTDMFIYDRKAKDQVRLTSKGVNRLDDSGQPLNDDHHLDLH